MASKKVFDLLEAEDWNELTELLINTAWTSQDLEEKHGVRSIICISLLKAHYSADMIRSRYLSIWNCLRILFICHAELYMNTKSISKFMFDNFR